LRIGGVTVFKRRRIDETPSGASIAPLPAGLPSGPDEPADEIVPAVVPPLRAEPAPDGGLGVPPFRPAQPKESPAMSRPPFAAANTAAPVPPAQSAAPRPGTVPPVRAPERAPSERRTLIVGRGISVQGTVQDAERLVVEGTVEASMIHATELAIVTGGVFKGEIEVEDAEIAGTIDGTLTARGSLIVRATGRVLGTARCRRLQVEDGGQITGRIEMITDQARETPARVGAETAAE
jgi:cytoskeletal protein CcmA (bactofilin family)